MIDLGYSIGRLLVGFGLIIAAVGGFLMLSARLGFGRLLGDFQITKGKATIFFPLASSIIISVVLTLILNLLARWRR